MTYQQAIEFWYGLIDYERALPSPADLTLDRMRALMHRLGDPQDSLRLIHVAGSKGKGSTSAMVASVLRAAGYRTGLFTSPHLSRVEERIQVNGESIAPERLAYLMGKIALATQEVGRPTFFEVATALGFLHFAESSNEAAVIEVGLGGRFDSTNICHPALAIITSISFDHTQQLGDRLASITREKAGIIKAGCSTISGATAPESQQIIDDTCRERGSPLWQLGRDFRCRNEAGKVRLRPRGGIDIEPSRVAVRTPERDWPLLEVGLLGSHQAANAALVIVGVEILRKAGFDIDDGAVRTGLAHVRWPARMEVCRDRPLVVLDCAHNVASSEALIDTLLCSFPKGRRILVFAASSDKDLGGILSVLAPHFEDAYLTRYTSNPRGANPNHLAKLFPRGSSIRVKMIEPPAEAWRQALAAASPSDLICVTGSVFLAGELLHLIVGRR
jgi:dihydrofolate synthase/folylpolyglutamate synthase